MAAGGYLVPLLTDGQWTDADPLHDDEPPVFEDDIWTPNTNEIRRPCVNRHRGMVNGLFLDFSVRKIGLKQLWELQWHKNWNPDNLPPPLWPLWMENFKDYWVE
jgi:prepilin-type processing-associated H-X9-DG protein